MFSGAPEASAAGVEGVDGVELLVAEVGSAAIIILTSVRIDDAKNSTCLISSKEKSLLWASEACLYISSPLFKIYSIK